MPKVDVLMGSFSALAELLLKLQVFLYGLLGHSGLDL